MIEFRNVSFHYGGENGTGLQITAQLLDGAAQLRSQTVSVNKE